MKNISPFITAASLLLLSPALFAAPSQTESSGQHRERTQGGPGRPGGPGGPGGPGRVSPLVTALDTDKDGVISAAEMAAAAVTLKTLDRNKDGILASEEFRPVPPPVVVPASDIVNRLMEFDRNADGRLSLTELPTRMKSLLKQADSNKDGILSKNELIAFTQKEETVRGKEAARREKIEAERQKQEGSPAPQRGPGGAGGPGRVAPIVSALDTNKDGDISAEEMANASDSLKTLDKNNDGTLTADELRPVPQPDGDGRSRGFDGAAPAPRS